MEDLNVSGMIRNRHLARSIRDAGGGSSVASLRISASGTAGPGRGRPLVPVEQNLLGIGHRLAELSLGTRQWMCPCCGVLHQRDKNAAKNILAAGQAVTACGAGVRHPGTSRVRPAVKQEPQPVTAGIPVLQGGE